MISLIEQYIEKNKFGKSLGMSFKINSPGEAEYSLDITEKHLATPLHAHGGVITAICDACMGVGALSLVADDLQVVSTLECKISFFEGVKKHATLKAHSTVLKRARKTIFMEASVYANEKLIAKSSGTFKIYAAERAGFIVD
jgi:uncharacterized protein (TIGR00369 family)